MTELNEDCLSDMLTALSESFTKERQKEEPYKELFKAGSTHTGLLRDLTDKMTDHVLDACRGIQRAPRNRRSIQVNITFY